MSAAVQEGSRSHGSHCCCVQGQSITSWHTFLLQVFKGTGLSSLYKLWKNKGELFKNNTKFLFGDVTDESFARKTDLLGDHIALLGFLYSTHSLNATFCCYWIEYPIDGHCLDPANFSHVSAEWTAKSGDLITSGYLLQISAADKSPMMGQDVQHPHCSFLPLSTPYEMVNDYPIQKLLSVQLVGVWLAGL